MSTIVKRVLSGSTDGKPLALSATAALTVHTCASSTNIFDEIYIYAHHNVAADLNIDIELGTSASGSRFTVAVPGKVGPVLIVPGVPIMGATTNPIIAAQPQISATSQSSTIYVTGYVNRITQ